MNTKTIRVQLCIPVTIEITGHVEDGEVVIKSCQIPGEGIDPRHLYENMDDDDYEHVFETLEGRPQ